MILEMTCSSARWIVSAGLSETDSKMLHWSSTGAAFGLTVASLAKDSCYDTNSVAARCQSAQRHSRKYHLIHTDIDNKGYIGSRTIVCCSGGKQVRNKVDP